MSLCRFGGSKAGSGEKSRVVILILSSKSGRGRTTTPVYNSHNHTQTQYIFIYCTVPYFPPTPLSVALTGIVVSRRRRRYKKNILLYFIIIYKTCWKKREKHTITIQYYQIFFPSIDSLSSLFSSIRHRKSHTPSPLHFTHGCSTV